MLIHFLQAIATPFAIIIGALIAGLFAMRQIKSNNITNARIKWLKRLKELIGMFVVSCNTIAFKYITDVNKKSEHEQRILDTLNEIILNLNPSECAHQRFQKLIEIHADNVFRLYREVSVKNTPNEDNFLASEAKVKKLAKLILKLEWEAAKKSTSDYEDYLNYGKGSQFKILADNFNIGESFDCVDIFNEPKIKEA